MHLTESIYSLDYGSGTSIFDTVFAFSLVHASPQKKNVCFHISPPSQIIAPHFGTPCSKPETHRTAGHAAQRRSLKQKIAHLKLGSVCPVDGWLHHTAAQTLIKQVCHEISSNIYYRRRAATATCCACWNGRSSTIISTMYRNDCQASRIIAGPR